MSESDLNEAASLGTESVAGSGSGAGGGGGGGRCRRCCRKYFTFLHLCKLMRLIGFLSLSTIGGIMLFALIESSRTETDRSPESITSILALFFHLITATILIIALFEADCLLHHIKLMESWIFLGFSMIYLSVLTLSTTKCEAGERFNNQLEMAIKIASYLLFFIGILFILLGCIGGKRMKKRRELKLQRLQRQREGSDSIVDV